MKWRCTWLQPLICTLVALEDVLNHSTFDAFAQLQRVLLCPASHVH